MKVYSTLESNDRDGRDPIALLATPRTRWKCGDARGSSPPPGSAPQRHSP